MDQALTPTSARHVPSDERRAGWIYMMLRDRIVKGERPPGERLREEDLAHRFGVSRTPVCQALQKLHIEGLVVNRPGRGLDVAELDPDEIAAALVQATSDRDEARVTQLNVAFHAAIWQISGHRRLQKMLNDLKDATQRFQRLILHHPGRMEQLLDVHRELLEAIRCRDGVAAESLARAHMRQVARIRMMLGVMGESDRPLARTVTPATGDEDYPEAAPLDDRSNGRRGTCGPDDARTSSVDESVVRTGQSSRSPASRRNSKSAPVRPIA